EGDEPDGFPYVVEIRPGIVRVTELIVRFRLDQLIFRPGDERLPKLPKYPRTGQPGPGLRIAADAELVRAGVGAPTKILVIRSQPRISPLLQNLDHPLVRNDVRPRFQKLRPLIGIV